MKKALAIILGISLTMLCTGCGKDEPAQKSEKAPDQIEKVGNAASTLGYDGEKIKEDLRGLQDIKKNQDKELEETFGN